jgi:D-lactate dehydrogenase
LAKIAFFEATKSDEAYVALHFDRKDIWISPESLNLDQVPNPDEIVILSVFINSSVGREALEVMPNLRLITTRSTGFDHIDVELCRAKGITVCNVPTYGDNTVAEHTFALILALSRKIVDAHSRARTGNFSLEGLQGFDLRGRTLGVVGTGHIGVHVIRIARGFMMKVIAFDSRPDRRLADALDFEYVESLDVLLGTSDVVTLHVPLLPATEHLINSRNIGRMKPGTLLINTARGGLIETSALLEALESGHLAGAGLDVFEGETLIKEEKQLISKEYDLEDLRTVIKDLVLLRHENVIVTPHVAFNSAEALERILITTLQNIAAFESGKPINTV